MSDTITARRPATFRLDDPAVLIDEAADSVAAGRVLIRPEPDLALPVLPRPLPKRRRRFRWSVLLWSALGGLAILGIGLSVSNLVADLFAKSDLLGWLGAALAALVALALSAIIGREAIGLTRLTAIHSLHSRTEAALVSDDREESRAIVRTLLAIGHDNPHLAHARATLSGHLDDIIDGADMIRLAEREMLGPLDREARRLIVTAAQRVSIATAISPKAAIDLLFVVAISARLMRQLAMLYGGRPGVLGFLSLGKQALTNLAVTGSMVAGDSLVQQVLGHGIAAKVSARLGEGLVNGLMTARLGLAAVDVIRPLPFKALPRPSLSELAKELLRRSEQDGATSEPLPRL
jgi:putative membrane protein